MVDTKGSKHQDASSLKLGRTWQKKHPESIRDRLCVAAKGWAAKLLFSDVFSACVQRSGLYAGEDCGLLACPPPRNFIRGRTPELPLNPLLHIVFVGNWCSSIPVCLSII